MERVFDAEIARELAKHFVGGVSLGTSFTPSMRFAWS